MASRIDRLIDQAERTNEAIRNLTALVLPLVTQAAPPPVKRATAIAPRIQEEGADAYFDAIRGVVQLIEDTPGNVRMNNPIRTVKKSRSPAQKRIAKMQSQAFKMANSALRKKNGQLKKGKTQRDVAIRAQKELKRMKNGTRKGQVRKTARRAYEGPRKSGGGRRGR